MIPGLIQAATPSRRSVAVGSLAVGTALILLAGRLSPIAAPPLYDGVVTVEPYRWLHPPAGQAGNPQGDTETVKVEKAGESPLVAVATPEQPPQAQIFAPPGGLTMPSGTTALNVSITPVDPVAPPSDGQVAGNVYRVHVADQGGAPLSAPASAQVSVVLRGPGDLAAATIERFDGTAWQPLKTSPAGFGSSFVAVVTAFGDFALVTSGPAPSGSQAVGSGAPAPTSHGSAGASAPPVPLPSEGGGVGSLLPLIVAAVAVGLLVGAALISRRSSEPPPPVRRRRAPPKRRR